MKNRETQYKDSLIPLHTLCESITDCHHSTPSFVEEGDLVIRSFNIKNGKLDLTKKSFTTSSEFDERNSRAIPEAGDLIITREAPMGEVCIIPKDLRCCLGQRMVLIKPNKKVISSSYLLYALLSPFVQSQIKQSQGTGSIVSNMRIPALKNLLIPINGEQEKSIAGILSALDKKIELNDKLNTELEAMTKLIYDYWFVQFDFPDENGEPYKSSGGKMVYNDDLKRKVPCGWIVRDLGSVTNILRGDLITSDTMKNGSVKVVSAGVKSSNFHDQANRSANVITVSSSGNAGYVNFWREPIFASDCITIQAGSTAETILALQFLKMIQMHIYRKASGSVQPHVYPSDLSSLKYLLPPKNLVDLFEGKVIAVNELIGSQNQENDKLEKLRDWLLPMLMNGQVKIK